MSHPGCCVHPWAPKELPELTLSRCCNGQQRMDSVQANTSSHARTSHGLQQSAPSLPSIYSISTPCWILLGIWGAVL